MQNIKVNMYVEKVNRVMKKIFVCIMLLFLCFNSDCIVKASNKRDNDTYNITMKQDLLCLMMAYPEYVISVECGDNEEVYLVMKSGKKILYDDKKAKNFEQKLANPDLQDMMEQVYPLSYNTNLMDKNFDPGRARHYALLKEVYGGSQKQLESNLTRVNLGYKHFQFNGNNKASESLKNAMKELIPLAQKRQDIGACMFPCSGTFNYRLIAGTNRLSPHSFGIAIDLARDKRDYWKWATPEEGKKRLNSYPRELVEIFEKNNFVWGGKWEHFDILHFEYRPEIIFKARYFGDKSYVRGQWYGHVPIEETSVKNYIEKINEVLK